MKGFHNPAQAALAAVSAEPLGESLENPLSQPAEIQKPLGQRFDFIEVCGGSGKVTDRVCKAGYVRGPVLDLSLSSQFNVADSDAIEWVQHMLATGRQSTEPTRPTLTAPA